MDADRHVFLYAFGRDRTDRRRLRRLALLHAVECERRLHPEDKLGFVGGPAKRNDFRHWMPTPAERHAVEMGKDQVCRFDSLTPGVYELRISGVALGGPATLTLDGARARTATATRRASPSQAAMKCWCGTFNSPTTRCN